MDREFATKVSRKDGRKSYLAVAWEVEVLAITDTRGAREEPLSDGLWNVQPKSLSPDWAALGNMIRQGEEVRVREKGCGFVLIVEGIGVRTAPSSACGALGQYPLGTAENRRVAPAVAGAGT